ncbi:hypothetical protein QJS10_CPA10g00014 [Acorus calamus]|uniref:Uncharacterized protein n=1 Tax=Acorus calamus TaxID=4465 RepID=A0AAV9DXC1_ACOCL|nr:hypothetical protein QJS10_CPA10g00014 [Acorus calamus]
MVAETPEHRFVSCPVAMILWSLLKEATGFDMQIQSLQGLWEVGCKMRLRGDRSVRPKVSQSLVPAIVWAIWLSQNVEVGPTKTNKGGRGKGFQRGWCMDEWE